MQTQRIPTVSRRAFLRLAAPAGLAWTGGVGRVRGANDDLRVAILGLGNKGANHVETFSRLPGVRIAALCDVDPQRLARQTEKAPGAFTATDPRRVLDRDDVDAVVIATPDHWHALLAVWACQTGRDVYVEKPVSHNLAEGRRIVDAAARYGRVVQAGTQYRSDPGLAEAAAFLCGGALGPVQHGHVVWYERRGSIGRVDPWIPRDLDYDLYCGPAPVDPLRRPQLHYDWHWVWSTGTGDLGNSGIHAFDVCRWFMGYAELPPRVISVGGRLGVDDVGETPNTQTVLLDYPSAPIFVEIRNLPLRTGLDAMDHYRGTREGVIVQCEGGVFAGLRSGGWAYDAKGKRIRQFVGDGGAGHAANFVEAVRLRKPDTLHAPILEGHISSACCHLGNLSCRLGRPSDSAGIREALAGHAHADEVADRLFAHLNANGIDPAHAPLVRGAAVAMDPARETTVSVDGTVEGSGVDAANRLMQGTYRAPFGFGEDA